MNVRWIAVLIMAGLIVLTWGGCTSRPQHRHKPLGWDPTMQAMAQDQLAAASSEADELWVIDRYSAADWPRINLAEHAALRGRGVVMVFRSADGGTANVVPERSAVHIGIEDDRATVRLSQSFRNPLPEPADVEYRLQLPPGALVNDFLITIGERRIRGIVRERAEAEFLFGEARRQGYRASRLTLDRKGELLALVSNIAAGGSIGVDLRFRQPMGRVGDTLMLHDPLAFAAEAGQIAAAIEIKAPGEIRDVRISHRAAARHPDGDPRRLILRLLEPEFNDEHPLVLHYTVEALGEVRPAPTRIADTEDLDRLALRDGLLTPGTAFIAVDTLSAGKGDGVAVPLVAP